MRIACDKQRTAEWAQIRCGRIGASSIGAVCSWLKQTKAEAEGGTRRSSQKRLDFLYEIVCERLTCVPSDHYVSPYMEHGTEFEDEARRAYELKTEQMVDQTGFVLHPSLDYAGASPDGLVGTDGGLEIKAPKTETHIGYLFGNEVPEEYRPQMYWSMACCERGWWDFASYDPRLPAPLRLFTKRLLWNDAEIDRITAEVLAFNAEAEGIIERLREMAGPFDLPAQMRAKQETAGGFITDADIEAAMKGEI